ncbi:MAG: hypothetical protein JW913_13375 [Chitinispirillaceae bacterium]|nr:hypothetical protein [Chitinispirillaceae bacterium]
MKNTAVPDRVIAENGYSVAESITLYRIDENSVTLNDGIGLPYALRSRCNAQFLKLTERQQWYYLVYSVGVTVELNEYRIRVDKDSLPSSWPGNDDVITPDSTRDPGDLIDW